MVIIRLSRGGRKNSPFYRVVVADQRAKLKGRFIENIGFYSPQIKSRDEECRLDIERIKYWLLNGAKLSDRVKRLLKSQPSYIELKYLLEKTKKKKKKSQPNIVKGKTLIDKKINNYKEQEARVIDFNEKIKKVDYLSDITIAEIRVIENHGEWDTTTTSSLVPIDGSSMVDWSKQNIEFEKLNRYLLVNRNTGKISWARIAKTRITYFCDSIQWAEPEFIDKNQWAITYNAEWSEKNDENGNVSIKFSNPFLEDGSYVVVKAWFGLSELVILDVEIISSNRFGEKRLEDLVVYIRDERKEFTWKVLKYISQPFKYNSKLIGVQARVFFGVATGIYRVRAGLLNEYPILSVEEIT